MLIVFQRRWREEVEILRTINTKESKQEETNRINASLLSNNLHS